jgi:hypothetical protein
VNEADGQIFNFLQSPAEARFARHLRHKAGLPHKAAVLLKNATEVKSRGKRRGNDFGVRKLASLIIAMTNSFCLFQRALQIIN